MPIRTPSLAALPLALMLATTAWAQATSSGAGKAESSAPPASSVPARKPRINQSQDTDSRNGAVTPSTPGTSRTPGTPGATGTPDHPSGG